MVQQTVQRWSGIAGWAMMAVMIGTAAQAQQPLSLTPEKPATASAAAPAVSGAAPAASSGTATSTPRSALVEVKELKPVTLDGKGLIDPTQAGLPEDVWASTSRPYAQALLTAQTAQQAPALSGLQRRLLVLNSPPPGNTAPGQRDGQVLESRIRQLLLLGLTEEVRALVDAVPEGSRSDGMKLSQVDALMLNGDTDAACGMVRQALPQAPSVPWQKNMVFCEFLAGHGEGSAMQTGLLRDQGENENDPFFFWVADSLAGLQVLPQDALVGPTPLTIAMLRSSGRPLPTGTLVAAPAWLARGLALSGQGAANNKIAPLMRAVAAEQAFARAALSREALVGLYEAVPTPAALTTAAIETLGSDPSPAASIALWLRAKAQGSVPDQAKVLMKAWEQAGLRGQRLMAAALYEPMVETMTPSAELSWFANTAARILLGSGNAEKARAWLQVSNDPGVSAMLNRLAFGNTGAPLTSDMLAAWQKNLPSTGNDAARLQQHVLTLLSAMGESIDPMLWAGLWNAPAVDGGLTPAASRWEALQKAAQQKHIGETVALVMMIADGQPLGTLSDGALSLMVDSLRQVGLVGDARAVAVQAAIALGV